MPKYPNHYTVKIDKKYDTDWVKYDDLMCACRTLNGSGLKLFIYLIVYHPGDEIEISPQRIIQETGMSLNSEKNAFKELQLKGYLVEDKPGYFIFNPTKN